MILRLIIVGLSMILCGFALYLVGVRGRQFVHLHQRVFAARAILDMGVAILVGLTGEYVYHTPGVELKWRTVLYVVGLVFIIAGFAGTYVEERRGK